MTRRDKPPPSNQGEDPPVQKLNTKQPFWPGGSRQWAIGLLAQNPKVMPLDTGLLQAVLTFNCQNRPPGAPGTRVEYVPVRVTAVGDLATYIQRSCSRHDLCFAEGRVAYHKEFGHFIKAAHFSVLHYYKHGFNTRMVYVRRVLWDHVWECAVRGGMDPDDPLKSFYYPEEPP